MLNLNKKTTIISLSIFSFIFLLSSYPKTFANEIQKTYKVRVPIPMSDGRTVWSYDNENNRNVREWATIKIKGRTEFKIHHSSDEKVGFGYRSYDHPVTAMKICLTDGFDISDCKVANSDTAIIPEGKTVKDLSIEIKYSESGREHRRIVTVPNDAKPE